MIRSHSHTLKVSTHRFIFFFFKPSLEKNFENAKCRRLFPREIQSSGFLKKLFSRKFKVQIPISFMMGDHQGPQPRFESWNCWNKVFWSCGVQIGGALGISKWIFERILWPSSRMVWRDILDELILDPWRIMSNSHCIAKQNSWKWIIHSQTQQWKKTFWWKSLIGFCRAGFLLFKKGPPLRYCTEMHWSAFSRVGTRVQCANCTLHITHCTLEPSIMCKPQVFTQTSPLSHFKGYHL